eukprot:363560-Chlamydomonas_euryale.AAC.18
MPGAGLPPPPRPPRLPPPPAACAASGAPSTPGRGRPGRAAWKLAAAAVRPSVRSALTSADKRCTGTATSAQLAWVGLCAPKPSLANQHVWFTQRQPVLVDVRLAG